MRDDHGASSVTLSPGQADTGAPTLSLVSDAHRPSRALRVLDERESERYRVGDEIARGGFGRILRAVDTRLARPVAIKELLSHASGSARLRFEREAIVTSRLQHPSCIPVYDTGVWPSGTPFFAMKLVEGRSLQQILAATADLRGRLALLPNVLAVADGLAYAHGQKILHRDLKPANVLVGAFGETVIIDWGLAKDLGDIDDGSDAVDPEDSPLAPALTLAGAAVGTVGYMAPEQALGRPVDERADVYALGALLYHVLAGTPPVVARGLGEYVSAFSQRLVPVAERATGVAPDLAAIVDKATASDPAARYPSAAYLAEDLRRFLSGQIVAAHRYSARELAQRFVHRHRAPLAVGVSLLAVLAASGVLSVRRVVHERGRAEMQRAAAEDLVGFVLYDLRHRLDALGKLTLLEGVGEKVAGYYDALERSGGVDVDVDASAARRRAAALTVLADVSGAQGDALRSERTRREAIRLRDRLGAAATTDDVVATASDLYALAAGLRDHGQLAPARATISAGLARLDHIGGADNVEVLRSRALGLAALGNIQYAEQGFGPALVSESTALAIDASLASAHPDDARLARETADVYHQLGELFENRGDVAAAEMVYRAALTTAERSARADPNDLEARAGVARGHMNLGTVLTYAAGDSSGGAAMLQASTEEWRALAERDPANLETQRRLMTSLSQLADHLSSTHQIDLAIAKQTEVKAITLRLVHADPGHDEWLRSLSLADNKLGDLARSERRWDDALALYRQATALRAFLVTKEPTNLRRQHDLATALERIGATLEGMGRLADSLASMEAAAVQRQRVLDLSPASIDYQRGLSIAALGVGEVALRLGQIEKAHAAIERSLALRRGIVAAMPANDQYQDYLGEALQARGELALAEHDLDTAAAVIAESLTIRKRIADLSPADASVASLLLVNQLVDGDLQRARGATTAAETIYRGVITAAQRGLAAHPKSNRMKEALALAKERLNRGASSSAP